MEDDFSLTHNKDNVDPYRFLYFEATTNCNFRLQVLNPLALGD